MICLVGVDSTRRGKKDPLYLEMPKVEVLRGQGVDEDRAPELDIILRMSIPGFESSSIHLYPRDYILTTTAALQVLLSSAKKSALSVKTTSNDFSKRGPYYPLKSGTNFLTLKMRDVSRLRRHAVVFSCVLSYC